MNHSVQSPFFVALAVTGWIASISFFFPNTVLGNLLILSYVIFLSIGFWKQKKSLTVRVTGDGVVRSLIISLVIPTCFWFFHLVELDILAVFFLPALGSLLFEIKEKNESLWFRFFILISVGVITFFLSFPDRLFYNPVFPERTLVFFVMLGGSWIYAWHKQRQTQASEKNESGMSAENLLSNVIVLWFVFLIQSRFPISLSSNIIAIFIGLCCVLFLATVSLKLSPSISRSSLTQRKKNETFPEVLPLLLSLALWTLSNRDTMLPLVLGVVIVSLHFIVFLIKNKSVSKQN